MSTTTISYFDSSNYAYQKARMHIYLKAKDVSLQDFVITSWTTLENDKTEWSTNAKNAYTVNYKELNVIVGVISQVQFQRICNLETAKEV